MAPLAELAKKGAIRPLLALARRKDPVSASEFAAASRLLHESAKRLREELVAAGLVEVRVMRHQGPIELLEIGLTPAGREVARLLLEADAAIRRAGDAG